MTHSPSWIDRLRIERVVWTLDQKLYDLPYRRRIATRREVRSNLLSAAADVGAKEALRNLGNSTQLANEYLVAEFGDAPRPSWIAAAAFLVTVQLVFTWLLSEAANGFGEGLTASNPAASGTFHWHGVPYLQDTVTFRLVEGSGSQVGGAWTPLAYGVWIVAAVCVGRLWRVVAVSRRRRQRAKELAAAG